MRKSILLLTSALILIFTMSSCGEKLKFPYYGYFGFKESVTVIEVDETVTSFRIEGEFTAGTAKDQLANPRVSLDVENTTAKHKVHFIHKSDNNNYLKPFIVSEGDKVYYDVEIMSQNITEEVKITYYITVVVNPGEDFPESNLTKTTIILRPKKVIK